MRDKRPKSKSKLHPLQLAFRPLDGRGAASCAVLLMQPAVARLFEREKGTKWKRSSSGRGKKPAVAQPNRFNRPDGLGWATTGTACYGSRTKFPVRYRREQPLRYLQRHKRAHRIVPYCAVGCLGSTGAQRVQPLRSEKRSAKPGAEKFFGSTCTRRRDAFASYPKKSMQETARRCSIFSRLLLAQKRLGLLDLCMITKQRGLCVT